LYLILLMCFSEALGNLGAIRIRRPTNSLIAPFQTHDHDHHSITVAKLFIAIPSPSFSCCCSLTKRTGAEKCYYFAFTARHRECMLYKKFWEGSFTYFRLMRYGPHRKRLFQQSFVAAGECLPSPCLAMMGGIQIHTYRIFFDTTRTHRKRRVQQFFYCCMYLSRELL
jgi:hypothetical protein